VAGWGGASFPEIRKEIASSCPTASGSVKFRPIPPRERLLTQAVFVSLEFPICNLAIVARLQRCRLDCRRFWGSCDLSRVRSPSMGRSLSVMTPPLSRIGPNKGRVKCPSARVCVKRACNSFFAQITRKALAVGPYQVVAMCFGHRRRRIHHDDPRGEGRRGTKRHQPTLIGEAEGARFELADALRRLRFSRPVQSAALPPLRRF
jgi:hypothetical protein